MWLPWFLIVTVVSASEISKKSTLEDPVWQEALSSAASSARAKRVVQGKPSARYDTCIQPSGVPGVCKPLKQCMQGAINNNAIMFMDRLCVMKQNNVGACCADDSNKLGPEGLAGDLPAIAMPDEDSDALLKITRAENRGCGLSTRSNSRVMGARPANIREWPWMASVTPTGFEQYCGGVLITDRHVLTAAHCTRRWEADELEVRLGEYDFKRSNESRSYNFKVVEKRQHVDFELSTYKNDIAILKLNRPAVFNTYVWPICLPPPGLELTNQTAIIIGWGTQWYGGPHSNVLMEVSVPIWDHEKCVKSFTDTVFEENICAGDYSGGKDACQGDSGGPLMYQMSSGRWATIGVVSWGVRCGEPNHPGLYTRVDKYLQWIVENVQF